MGRGVPGLVGLPVPGQVEEDHLESPLGQVGGQAATELVVEQQPVQEHERPCRPRRGARSAGAAPRPRSSPLRRARRSKSLVTKETGASGPGARRPAPGARPAPGPRRPAPGIGRGWPVHRIRTGAVVVRRVLRSGARAGSRRIGSADPGPHGRHKLDVTRVAFPSAPPLAVTGPPEGVTRPVQMSRSWREQAGHWPQPLRAWSFWAAWSCTAGGASDGSPGKPSPRQVDRLN